ncbi:MAG: 2-C-methyl-D-erythritol 4-phosphate cytidylyltransferase, partial [Bacteroidaceae bacterium]|nr:2-C-methyl-D-erythritol 4-phosphate cytidylyltransferase [Bacteroidaceae bacterium]
ERFGHPVTLVQGNRFSLPYTLATGGETRFHSVKNGLAKVSPDATLIGVHDGVRPFVSVETIGACYEEAARSEAVVPVTDVVETLRHISSAGEFSETVPRGDYRLVQTPQVFSASLLRQAYHQPYTDFFTDDASVVERFGHPVTLVQGNHENIKITTPFDLTIASALL